MHFRLGADKDDGLLRNAWFLEAFEGHLQRLQERDSFVVLGDRHGRLSKAFKIEDFGTVRDHLLLGILAHILGYLGAQFCGRFA